MFGMGSHLVLYMGRMLPGHIWAMERCPGTYGHWKRAQAHMGTERVPRHARTLEYCLGTKMVPEHIWAPEWCPGTFGQRKGARAHMGTGIMPGHIFAP